VWFIQWVRNAQQVPASKAGRAGFPPRRVINHSLNQAGRESGGRAAGKSALDTLSQNLGSTARGAILGQMRKFQKYGISTSGSNEDVLWENTFKI